VTTIPLPFERGSYWESGTMGSVPTDLLGARFVTPDGVELEIQKNGNAAVLYGTQAVAWKNPHVAGNVELVDADNQKNVAGFVDHQYANNGKTVPANALFYAVKRGDVYVRSGAAVTPGQAIRTDAGASALAEGRVQGAVTGLSNNLVGGAFYGSFLATGVAASAINTGSVLARVFVP
jgi:hypothetical protein